MPRHLISDAHEWINKIPTVPTYYLAKPQFVLSTRGYKPWRPDAVMGTTRGVNKSVLRLFKRS